MAIREWWISSVPSEDQIEAMVCCDGPYADGYENIHVIEATGMPTREEIQSFLDFVDDPRYDIYSDPAGKNILKWLQKLAED